MATTRTELDSHVSFDDLTIDIPSSPPTLIPNLDSPSDEPLFDYQQMPSEKNQAAQPLLINETKKADEKKQIIASSLIKDFQNKTQPIKTSEYPVVAFSALAAAAAASPAHDFSKNFLNNVIHINGEPYVWTGTALAAIPQFLLSLKTNIERWSIIYRSLPDITFADIRSNIKPITVTGLSALPTFKVGVDCKDFETAPALGYTVGGLRSASAIGFNSYFYIDHLQKQVQEKKKDVPIIKMLSDAKIAITHVKHEKLIEAFQTDDKSTTNFLKHFKDHHDPIEQTNNIVNLFIRIAEQHASHQHHPKAKAHHCGTFTSVTSWGFGFLSSMMNWKTATKVPELFKLEVAKDILHFISRVLEEADPKLISAFILGGAIIGLPSWYLNFLANRKACANAFDKFCKIREEGFKKHFWDKYKDNSTMLKDWGLLFVTAVFSIGLGVANGGMAYRYPFLDFEIVRIINAVTTGAVFMGLGFMSVDGFITSLEDKKDQKLLLDAFDANDLQNYFDTLDSDEKKHRFIILLKKYLHSIIDSLISSFAKLDDVTLNDLLSEEAQQKLPQFSKQGFFLTPPQPSTPVAGDYIDIKKPSKPLPVKGHPSKIINLPIDDEEDIIESDDSLSRSAHEDDLQQQNLNFTEDNEDEDLLVVSFSPSV